MTEQNNTQPPVTTPPSGEVEPLEQDVDQILADLEKDLASDEVPAEITELDKGNKDAQGRASHAFAEQKRKQKQLLQILKSQQEQLSRISQTPPPPTPQATPDQQKAAAASALANLRARACANLGLPSRDAAPELVDMETQRLYIEQINEISRRTEAQRMAPVVVREVLSSLPVSLTEADKREIASRVSRANVLQQVDESFIKAVASQYLGEKMLNGDGTTPAASNGNPPGVTSVPPGAVKAVGSRGVRPADRPASPPVAPATAEEIAEMSKHGFHDLQAFREAKANKGKYRTQ